jgi:hypothetical protein
MQPAHAAGGSPHDRLSDLASSAPIYVPALRWKQGEIRALKELADERLLGGILPLLLIDSQKERKQHDPDSDVPHSPASFIDFVAGEVQELLHDRQEAYIDTRLFDYANDDYDGLGRFFMTLHAGLMPAIPVLRRNAGAACIRTIKPFAKERGICLRLRLDSLEDTNDLEELVSSVDVDDRLVDIVFDLFELPSPLSADESARRIEMVLKKGRWRRCAIIGGSCRRTEKDNTDVPLRMPRLEVIQYRDIATILKTRVPIFGDYGIVLPKAHPATGGGATGPSPIIRYCTREAWYIWSKNEQYTDYRRLTHACAPFSEFMGAQFSPGDATIERIARGDAGPTGNASTWITTDTSHHLLYTVRQSAKLLPSPEPLEPSECRYPGKSA